MKKIYIAFALIGGTLFTPFVADADFSFIIRWKQWVESRQNFYRTPLSTSSMETTPVYTPYTPYTPIPVIQTERTSPVRRILRIPSYTQNQTSGATAKVIVTAIQPRESVHTITTDPITIFKVGVQNTTLRSSTTFTESLLLDQATFQLFSNTGIAEDVRDLELEIAGSTAKFDEDGMVTVRFHNARISRGDSLDFDVSIRIKDPSSTPHIPGTLRLRLEEMTAVGESSQKKIDVQEYGTLTSSQIVFDPVSTVTGGGSYVSTHTYTNVTGRTIAAGEEVHVMSASFTAHYDDLSIRELTLRNTLTGGNIDPFIDRVRVIDLRTGEIVSTGRFTNGAAKFFLSPRIFVGREERVRLGFEVTVADPIPSYSVDSRFELDIAPSDLLVESRTTGRPLPDANKTLSIDSSVFAFSQGRMTIAANAQQKDFAVGTNSPETVFRFMVNGGSNDVSLGRISLDVYPSGCEFDGGALDVGDVKLVRIRGGYQEYDEAVNITASGNKITLDFPDEFYLYRNDSVEFGLQLQLDNLPGDNDNDLLSVRLLGDSAYQKGTLAAVRSAGSNFIWSDVSARMHSTTTTDWISGQYVSGLPSRSVIVRRFGN